MNRSLIFRLAALAVLACGILAGQAAGQTAVPSRQALVIANADYRPEDDVLPNLIEDARAVADELGRSGFDVDVRENLTKQGMLGAIDDFKARIRPGSAALFVFSGHGIQVGRQSYLVPVNAHIWSEQEVRRDGIDVEAILAAMTSRGASVRLAIIDASRRNPFERRLPRGFSSGLAAINASQGALVISAAAPGQISPDSRDGRSLFLGELIKEMRSPGVSAEQVFIRTRLGVAQASGGAQVPWTSSSLVEDFFFKPAQQAGAQPAQPIQPAQQTSPATGQHTSIPSPIAPASLPPPLPPPDPAETAARRACDVAVQEGRRTDWERILAQYPNAPCAAMAREQVDLLSQPPPAKAGPAPSAGDQDIRDLDEAVDRSPKDADVYYRRGQAFAKRGEYQRAIADFDRALRLDPTHAEALNNRCWTRAILGQLPDALADCNRSLTLQPQLADAHDSRGFAKLKMGDARAALADYDVALRGNPQHPYSLYGRGKAKLRLGDLSGGRRDIEAAKAIKPDIEEEFQGFGLQ